VNRFVSSLLLLVFLEWPPPVLFLMRSFWHGMVLRSLVRRPSDLPLLSPPVTSRVPLPHSPCPPSPVRSLILGIGNGTKLIRYFISPR